MTSTADIGALARSDAKRTRAPLQAAMPYSRARHFDRILRQRAITTVYQPIVDLESREVLAYEALTRGPAGTALERPDLLFATARDCGMVRELDWVCRAKAMETAMRAGFGGGLTLFVNVEPDVVATRAPEDLILTLKNAERDLRVVLEVTERALLERPAELIHWLSWARERWWGVALDDVGATSESLALMPFVNPDVIKLDFRFIRQPTLTAEDLRVIEAVREHAGRTGATVLAEGIETAKDLQRARDLGATLAQGWFFGRPGALPQHLRAPKASVPLLPAGEPERSSGPWEVLTRYVPDHQSLPEAHARRLFAKIEQGAILSREAPLVLGSFPGTPGPWGTPEERLGRLRPAAAFCGAVGVGLDDVVTPRWHTTRLAGSEEMADEWSLAVIAPHHAEAIVAYDAGDRGPRGERLLDVVTTSNRQAVSRVAELLMRKLAVPVVGVDGRLLEQPVR